MSICHDRELKSIRYKMKPCEKAELKVLLVAKCSVCKTIILELYRTDYKGNDLPVYKLRGKDAEAFLDKNKSEISIEKEPKEPQNKFPTWVYFDGKKSEKNIYDWRSNRKVGECLQPLNQD